MMQRSRKTPSGIWHGEQRAMAGRMNRGSKCVRVGEGEGLESSLAVTWGNDPRAALGSLGLPSSRVSVSTLYPPKDPWWEMPSHQKPAHQAVILLFGPL
jgi:hypothetical protein